MIKNMRLKRTAAIVIVIGIMVSAFASIPALADYDMPYFIDVDITNQITTIYSSKDGSIVRQMICSTGMNNSTPLGVYYMVPKGRASERTLWTWLAEYHCYVHYMTRVHLGYMFHSLPYTSKEQAQPDQEAIDQLGTPASHGCVRLWPEDAEFIAKNCLTGTRVNFFESGEPDEELRQLLLESSYTGEDGMSYNEFLGYSETALGRGSGGEEVSDLQHRLVDLGYFEGDCNGQYNTDTVKAVKQVQADLGLTQNGITDDDLQTILYSDDAPVSSGNTTLQLGNSGPVVKKLQEALTKVGVYSGDIDGIYDPDVEQAVKLFQGACNFTADGIATPNLQQILYYELGQIEESCGEDFTATADSEEIVLATVRSETKIIVRDTPDVDGKEIGKVKDGDTVVINAVDGDWAQVLAGDYTGYMKKKYLEAYKQQDLVLKYEGSLGVYSIGHTMQEYLGGAESLAQKYVNGIPDSETVSDEKTAVQYVTVNTGSDDVGMNLRSGPGSDNDVVAEIANGTTLEVTGSETGWTKVSFNGTEGYLMNDYLLFDNSDDDLSEEDEAYGENITALVINDSDVFDAASADADRIGTIQSGTTVQVVDASGTDYVLIECEGHQGYMLSKVLQFQLN